MKTNTIVVGDCLDVMREMISFGGGINSVAMTIMLVEQGWRGPIVFADTGGEKPDTYCYLDYLEQEFLEPYSLSITRLSPGSSYHRSMSQVSLETYCLRERKIPLLAVRWCSSRWKGRPLDRWASEHDIGVQNVGISADEARRTHGKPSSQHFPLVEENINREGCRQIILGAGLEVPLWSSCFFCPGQRLGEWRYIHDHFPELFERARQMEQNASKRLGRQAMLNSNLSLDEMVARGWDMQLEMDLSQWLPCACRL